MAALEDAPIARVPRQPGQREPRWRHRVGLAEQIDPSVVPILEDADADEMPVLPGQIPTRNDDLEWLKAKVAELEERIAHLERKPGRHAH
jgi:uncharacterized protein YceH (UPF0502 family)